MPDPQDGTRPNQLLPSGWSLKWPTPVEWAIIGASVALTIAILLPSPKSAGGSRSRELCKQNLKAIALALHEYHDKFGSFPPAYIADEKGRPMHSWRVLILPYLNKQLYDRYRFDEPWDGPSNKVLSSEIGEFYSCRYADLGEPKPPIEMTSYVAVVGPETAWRGTIPVKMEEIVDGLDQTLFVIEINNSGIHCMEPRDVTLAGMATTINSHARGGFSSKHKAGAHAILVDGSARFFSQTLPAATIRALLTRNGREKIPDFE